MIDVIIFGHPGLGRGGSKGGFSFCWTSAGSHVPKGSGDDNEYDGDVDMMLTMVVVDFCMFPRVQVKIQFCFLFPCFDSRSSSDGLLPSDWLESVLFIRLAERASKIYI